MIRSTFSMVVLIPMLVSSLAFADELPPCNPRNLGQCVNEMVCSNTPMGPGWMQAAEPEECGAALPQDAPLDLAGVSVYLRSGWGAPYEGHLVSLAETKRRAKKEAGEGSTLASAQADGILLPRPVFYTLLTTTILVLLGGIALGICVETTGCLTTKK